jgi:hypothetical protein
VVPRCGVAVPWDATFAVAFTSLAWETTGNVVTLFDVVRPTTIQRRGDDPVAVTQFSSQCSKALAAKEARFVGTSLVNATDDLVRGAEWATLYAGRRGLDPFDGTTPASGIVVLSVVMDGARRLFKLTGNHPFDRVEAAEEMSISVATRVLIKDVAAVLIVCVSKGVASVATAGMSNAKVSQGVIVSRVSIS